MNAYNLYEDVADMAVLRTHIEKQMVEYNSTPGVVRLDLVLFKDAVEHVCRIVRVISQPRGNVLLVGVGKFHFLVSVCEGLVDLTLTTKCNKSILVR